MNTKSALAQANNIDIHAHAVLAGTMNQAGDYGPELGRSEAGQPWFRVGDYRLDGVRYEGGPFMELDLRLAAMDSVGLDMQVLSPNPLTYFHFIDTEFAVNFCHQHNLALAEWVKQAPDRIGAFAALPMQNIDAACDELTFAVQELGMLGGYIGSDIGRPLNDPELDKFYARCVELDVPLMIHPAPAGIDGPKGDPNLLQFDLDLLTGFAAQETIAVSTLIYGGVLLRHPKLDICLSHAGGAVMALIGRLNRACVKRPWVPEALRYEGAFEEYLQKLWFDTHVHDDRVLGMFSSLVGTSRLVLGTNFAGWDQHELEVSSEDMKLYADNACRLLRADGMSG
ncbi:MAG: amidohydrolase family protein [Pseudomonadota bacterium]